MLGVSVERAPADALDGELKGFEERMLLPAVAAAAELPAGGDLGRVAALAAAAAAEAVAEEEAAADPLLGDSRADSVRCASWSNTTCSVPLISARQNGHRWFAPSPLSSHCVRHDEHNK